MEELLNIAFAVCALGPLAARFGHHSRARLRPREEEVATSCMAWIGDDRC
jgi:hypothetical protein